VDGLALGILILVLLVVVQVFATCYFAVCYFRMKLKYENLYSQFSSQGKQGEKRTSV
jgi:hypothetical protein